MTDELKDGGPAYPRRRIALYQIGEDGIPNPIIEDTPGMSLRDWFAGQALIGMMGAMRPYSDRAEQCARDAYLQADAMLAERVKRADATP